MPFQSFAAIVPTIVALSGPPLQTDRGADTAPDAAPGAAPRHAGTDSVPAADREAILAMAGAFSVSFHFEETVAIAPGYSIEEPYSATAKELIRVIADEGDFISLQHVLVVDTEDSDPLVIKHWRQDWRFEDTRVLAFSGHATWQRETRSPDEVRGSWTQAVFQTTDAPRYEAVGRWTHVGNQSSWESELTWRPLPRRERHRRDYDVVVCRNRHTITPSGWVHEQDNQKLALSDGTRTEGVLVHEIGLNRYERIDMSEVAAAVSYWAEHASAWADVRSAWTPLLQRDRLAVHWRVDGKRLSTVIDRAIEDAAARERLPRQLAAFVSAGAKSDRLLD